MPDKSTWDDALQRERAARSALTEARRENLKPRERVDGVSRWWKEMDLVLSMSAEALSRGQVLPGDMNGPLIALAKIARELAAGKIPDCVSDVATAGNKPTAAEQRDVDFATVYLLACGDVGWINARGEVLKILDVRPNKTVEATFAVSYDTARGWRDRDISHLPTVADADDLIAKFRVAGARYAANR